MDQENTIATNPNTLAESPVSTRSKANMLPWIIYFCGIAYYCFAYILRVYPSVMETDLLSHYQITATSLGFLLSAYYFTYAPAQLVVGLTVDRFGARHCILMACLIATSGTLVFTLADSYTMAFCGRLLIGLGAAFAYVTALKLAILWLPKRFFAAATGAVTGFGMVVAFVSNKLLVNLVQNTGYKAAMYSTFVMGIALLLLLFLIIRDKKQPKTESTNSDEESYAVSMPQLFEYLVAIVKNPQMWIIGIVGTLMYLPATVFSDAWGLPYLEAVYHLTPQDASNAILVMMLGWTSSSFIAGALSDIFRTRKQPIVIAAASATVICSLLFYAPHLSHTLIYTLMFLLGVTCGPHPLCFTLSKENNPPKVAATAMAFANFLIMMGGFIFQPIVGKLLDLGWQGAMMNGVRVYSSTNYTIALSIIPVGLLIAGILTIFMRETYHHHN